MCVSTSSYHIILYAYSISGNPSFVIGMMDLVSYQTYVCIMDATFQGV